VHVPDPNIVEQGRAAFAARSWTEAHLLLTEADQSMTLEAGDLSTLATAAYLSGHPEATIEVLGRAHQAYRSMGALDRAAGCAYWLAFSLLNRGEHAQAAAWVSRALVMLDENATECVERGYLNMLRGIQTLMQGDPEAALPAIEAVVAIARRYDDADLIAMSGLGKGQALIALDRTEEGLAILDEVMVAATAGELSEAVAGLAYCAIISVCQDILDVRRAREWTAALSRWCADQPDLVPYSGHCLVHRSEIHQLEGDWNAARAAAEAAHGRYAVGGDWSSDGLAYYREAELYRLRGEYDAAEAAYRECSRRGQDPQPGMTLLRLAQGDVASAATSTRRMLQERLDLLRRARILAVHVEVMLASGEIDEAHEASAALAETAARYAPSMLKAVSLSASGAVELARGDSVLALSYLREARSLWQELSIPYEVARTRELIGSACRRLGDTETAELELGAAAEIYRALGARPDLDRVASPPTPAGNGVATSGLTARELEVLRLVAAGKSNRTIASDLVLSEKTVARHISNIFTKLDLSSRSAATAYAYEHHLV
jgi:DNA-binding NarL/FixJ family response regulator